jgi:hypothetical protein
MSEDYWNLEIIGISLGTGFMLLRIGTHGGLLRVCLNDRLTYLYKRWIVINVFISMAGCYLLMYVFKKRVVFYLFK